MYSIRIKILIILIMLNALMKLFLILFFSFDSILNTHLDVLLNIPQYYNWKNVSPECIHSLMHQGLCDSSGPIVAASILSDRLCISTYGAKNIEISPLSTYTP